MSWDIFSLRFVLERVLSSIFLRDSLVRSNGCSIYRQMSITHGFLLCSLKFIDPRSEKDSWSFLDICLGTLSLACMESLREWTHFHYFQLLWAFLPWSCLRNWQHILLIFHTIAKANHIYFHQTGGIGWLLTPGAYLLLLQDTWFILAQSTTTNVILDHYALPTSLAVSSNEIIPFFPHPSLRSSTIVTLLSNSQFSEIHGFLVFLAIVFDTNCWIMFLCHPHH